MYEVIRILFLVYLCIVLAIFCKNSLDNYSESSTNVQSVESEFKTNEIDDNYARNNGWKGIMAGFGSLLCLVDCGYTIYMLLKKQPRSSGSKIEGQVANAMLNRGVDRRNDCRTYV